MSHCGEGHADFLCWRLKTCRKSAPIVSSPTTCRPSRTDRPAYRQRAAPAGESAPTTPSGASSTSGVFFSACAPNGQNWHPSTDGRRLGRSSVGPTAPSNHWSVVTREHLDRYHQPVFRAQPIATLAGTPPEFDATPGTSGLSSSTRRADAPGSGNRHTRWPGITCWAPRRFLTGSRRW